MQYVASPEKRLGLALAVDSDQKLCQFSGLIGSVLASLSMFGVRMSVPPLKPQSAYSYPQFSYLLSCRIILWGLCFAICFRGWFVDVAFGGSRGFAVQVEVIVLLPCEGHGSDVDARRF